MALTGFLLAATLCAPAARPVISEVYYDAIGDDSGHEFVELLNPGDAPHALEGVRIESGDGSASGRWTLRWTGGPEHEVPARGRFVVGGARVTPPTDATASLDLQNGPDAIRLVWPDGAVEVVGYGVHEFPEYACGTPAPDVPSGRSLARIPDDASFGANALDFQPAEPSPGRPNQSQRDLAMMRGALALDPEQPTPGSAPTLSGRVVNRGRAGAGTSEIALRVRAHGDGLERTLADGPIALDVPMAALSPGDTASWRVTLDAMPAGRQVLIAEVLLAGDETTWNDADSLWIRAGPGPLVLTEIQFHPVQGEGEWVEVRNDSGADLDLAAFTISDRGAGRGRPVGGEGALPAGALAILAQDRAALLARHPALDGRRVWQARPWGSLNNSDGPDGSADEVVLRESDGTTSDRHAYRAAGVPSGVPIERRTGGDWWPAVVIDGTPLVPYQPPPPIDGHLRLSRRRLRAGDGARLAWSLPWRRAVVDVDLYDLGGARVARLIGGDAVPDLGERGITLTNVPPGLYLLVMQARDADGRGALQAAEALRVEGAAR